MFHVFGFEEKSRQKSPSCKPTWPELDTGELIVPGKMVPAMQLDGTFASHVTLPAVKFEPEIDDVRCLT